MKPRTGTRVVCSVTGPRSWDSNSKYQVPSIEYALAGLGLTVCACTHIPFSHSSNLRRWRGGMSGTQNVATQTSQLVVSCHGFSIWIDIPRIPASCVCLSSGALPSICLSDRHISYNVECTFYEPPREPERPTLRSLCVNASWRAVPMYRVRTRPNVLVS